MMAPVRDSFCLMANSEDNTAMIEIEIDDEVFAELQRLAEPLVDDANSVLRRVLLGSTHVQRKGFAHHGKGPFNVAPELTVRGTVHRRAPSNELFPKERFTLPILDALVELGGSASPKEIMDRVFAKIGDQLGPVDLERPQHGGVRWLSRAHYHRYELIERGLIENRSRGVWTITDDGREYLQQQQASDANQTT